MKIDKIDTLIIVSLIISIVIGFVIGFTTKPKDKEIVIEKDTVYVNVTDSTIITQIDSLYTVIDNLEYVNLNYEEELTIAILKLERIKDYNEIAAKGNNIKYLRGWINRVLDE